MFIIFDRPAATSTSSMTSISSFPSTTHVTDIDRIFPPLPSTESSPTSPPVNNLTLSGMDSAPNVQTRRVLLPPIHLG